MVLISKTNIFKSWNEFDCFDHDPVRSLSSWNSWRPSWSRRSSDPSFRFLNRDRRLAGSGSRVSNPDFRRTDVAHGGSEDSHQTDNHRKSEKCFIFLENESFYSKTFIDTYHFYNILWEGRGLKIEIGNNKKYSYCISFVKRTKFPEYQINFVRAPDQMS